jgi:hypothetical protein
MAVLSNTILSVTLPSGNRAVYELQPQHLNEVPGLTLAERARAFGKQMAHETEGRWYKSGGWDEITDLRTIALLERAPEA